MKKHITKERNEGKKRGGNYWHPFPNKAKEAETNKLLAPCPNKAN